MKYKIGYIPGSWDLFHIGHLNIIKRAKSCCETLIVAVSTDELVREKNISPLINFKARIEIVRAIRYVDFAVKQENHNKFEAWKQYRFNAIFGGDDLKGSERWTKLERQFAEVNVDVIYFNYTKETSSTFIRESINNTFENKNEELFK